jgi:hypothetical protein
MFGFDTVGVRKNGVLFRKFSIFLQTILYEQQDRDRYRGRGPDGWRRSQVGLIGVRVIGVGTGCGS